MTNGVREVAKRSRPEENFGRKFGKDGHLTITGVDDTCHRITGSRMFKVYCSTCAKDSELFGDGVFSANLGNLTKGSIPCGCAKNTWWSAEQSLIRVIRATSGMPCEVLGYAELYKGFETKLHLRCKIHRAEWKHTTVHTVTNSGRYRGMCIECEREFITKGHASLEDAQAEEILATGRFPKGTQIWRAKSIGDKSVWGMLCGKCSSDEFVENSLCTGVFETTLTGLKQGRRPCRCSDKYRYTPHQRRYQIEKIIADTSAAWVFTGYVEGTFDRRMRLEGFCDHHGEFSQSVSHLVSNSSGCPMCAKGGFNRSKTGYVYVLRVVGTTGNFTGYGISNKFTQRIIDHNRNLKNAGFSIAQQEVFECPGRLAAQIEIEIKGSFPLSKQDVCGFKTEATHYDMFEDVVEHVTRRLSDVAKT